MEDLTFGEQVKIILSRKGMTIKQLAEMIEEHTGKPMSRQNLTQRLGRDNFQEQDMRMIAAILGCPFHLSIFSVEAGETVQVDEDAVSKYINSKSQNKEIKEPAKEVQIPAEAKMTVGEIYDLHSDQGSDETAEVPAAEPEKSRTGNIFQRKKDFDLELAEAKKRRAPSMDDPDFQPVYRRDIEEDREKGEINPYTGREYQTNSVRTHPKKIGFVQVYDRANHGWTDMTEWAFLGFQEKKKVELGKKYEPPIYLD